MQREGGPRRQCFESDGRSLLSDVDRAGTHTLLPWRFVTHPQVDVQHTVAITQGLDRSKELEAKTRRSER
jgi:hypothetical protein